jgi:putative restriction endonuclease
MKLYLGVTDYGWYRYLSGLEPPPEDINFWQPGGGQGFKVLKQGEPFLFKLKAPHNAIGGVGFFSSWTRLPLSVAWETFGPYNGTDSFFTLQNKILNYRAKQKQEANPQIGCIVLTNPVFFHKEDWIPVPDSWAKSIVQGKSYEAAEGDGRLLWSQLAYTLEKYRWLEREVEQKSPLVQEPEAPEYREILSRVRVGQGSFRVLITEAYRKRCAVSAERTLPVLEAAHIKPYAQSGPHFTSNGLLLRSDLHKLFDSGYMTVTRDHHVEISDRIKTEFENGRDYYKYHGQKLLILPEQVQDQPSSQYLDWHNQNVFR